MTSSAWLMARQGAGPGPGPGAERWPLDRDATTIGRWEGNDIVLGDQEASRRHAQIRRDAGRYVLVDLGSKNGTFVNGVRIAGATPLRDGDEISIPPRSAFVFVDNEATTAFADARPGLRIDVATRLVTMDGRALDPPLAPNQFALLLLLASHPGRVFTREEIAAACYPGEAGGVSDLAIDGIVRRLRARLQAIDPSRDHVAAVRGHGFRYG